MRLAKLTIRNFRSCKETEVDLAPGLTVLVGENASGKSAIIDALRLTTLSSKQDRRATYQAESDLSFSTAEGESTSVSLTYTDLTIGQQAAFITQLVDPGGDLTYTFTFDANETAPYWKRVSHTVGKSEVTDPEPAARNRIAHIYLPPLRDAVREIDSGSGERIAEVMQLLVAGNDADKKEFIDSSNKFLENIAGLELPSKAKEHITKHFKEITPPSRAHDLEIGGKRHTLRRLASILRLRLKESGIDPVEMGSAGLGYANLVYIATIIVQLSTAQDHDLTLLLVEEPEAHLHPQLQTVLLNYLNEQVKKSNQPVDKESVLPSGQIQVIVTTHSPHLVSSVSVKNVAVVAREQDNNPGEENNENTLWRTRVTSLGNLGLSDTQVRKVDRYLTATRAALLFARHVVLVEGISEAILLPVLALRYLQEAWAGKSNSEEQIALGQRHLASLAYIAIDGVDFTPYLSILFNGASARVDRVAVITDGDPTSAGVMQGYQRQGKIEAEFPVEIASQRLAVFCGETTLEADLFGMKDNEAVLKNAFVALHPNSGQKWDSFVESLNENQGERSQAFADAIRAKSGGLDIAKGDFAQLVAESVERPSSDARLTPPHYLRDAIKYILAGYLPSEEPNGKGGPDGNSENRLLNGE